MGRRNWWENRAYAQWLAGRKRSSIWWFTPHKEWAHFQKSEKLHLSSQKKPTQHSREADSQPSLKHRNTINQNDFAVPMLKTSWVKSSATRFVSPYIWLYVVICGMIFLGEAWVRPIWLDEQLTYYQCKDKDFIEFFRGFNLGINALPYLYFIWIWLIDQIMGLNFWNLRFPSLVCGILSVLLLHEFLRKISNGKIAFIAIGMGLLFVSQFAYYITEARPYSALLFATVLNVVSTKCLREQRSGSYVLNAAASFLVPSIHYVGIFYSGVLGVVFVLWADRKQWKCVSSYFIGWVLFAMIHGDQIRLFLHETTLIQADVQPDPTLNDLNAWLASFAGAIVILLGVTILSRSNRAHFLDLPSQTERDFHFLALSGMGFVFIPVLYKLAAILGLPNLAHERYYFPSLLANVFAVVILLVVGSHVVDKHFARLRVLIRVVVVLLLVPGIFGMLSALWPVMNTDRKERRFSDQLLPRLTTNHEGQEVPLITGNLHVYFGFLFNYPEAKENLCLLRATRSEANNWKTFHGNVRVLSENQLSDLDQFVFAEFETTANNLPDFDVSKWAKANGYSFLKEDHLPLRAVYRVSRMHPLE